MNRERAITTGLLLFVIAALIGLCFLGVVELQYADADHGWAATSLKWLGLVLFLALNVVLIADVLAVAVNPYLVRRDERADADQTGGVEQLCNFRTPSQVLAAIVGREA